MKYRPRHIAAVVSFLALPAFTCGVAPALRELIERVEAIENELLALERPPYVVDANGEQVGRVVGVDAGDSLVDLWLYASVSTAVQLSVDDFPPFVVTATRDELQVRNLPPLHFESDDCTGTPWVVTDAQQATSFGSPSLWPKISLPGIDSGEADARLVFIADPEAEPESFQAASTMAPTKTGPNGAGSIRYEDCKILQSTLRFGLPMSPVADLDDLYLPPFRIVTEP